jgi:hypothetical protein
MVLRVCEGGWNEVAHKEREGEEDGNGNGNGRIIHVEHLICTKMNTARSQAAIYAEIKTNRKCL